MPAALLKDYADNGMTTISDLHNYVISQYPGNYEVSKDGFTITVIVKDGTRIVNPGDNDQSSDQFTTSTRTIKYIVPAGHAAIADGTQTAYFERAKLIDAVTGTVRTNFTGDFDGVHFTNGYAAWDPSDGTWAEYDVEQIPNYDSYVEGNKSTSVAEDDYVPAGYDTTVHVTYTDQLVPVIPGNSGVTPDNPEYQNLFHTVTRKIIVNNPVTGHQDVTNQTVVFGRTGLYDKATGKFVDNGYGDWQVFQDGHLTKNNTGTWDQFTSPQFSGWTPNIAQVEEKDVTATTSDETVVISYTSNQHNNPGHSNNPGQPGNPGTPGQPENSSNPINPGSTVPNGSIQPGQPGTSTNHNLALTTPRAQKTATVKRAAAINTKKAAKNKKLPQTGNQSIGSLLALGLASLLGFLGLAGQQRKED